MKILIIGSTGVLGRNVIPRLMEKQIEVKALVRTRLQMDYYNHLGIEALEGDILKADSISMASEGCQAAMHLATVIPGGTGTLDWSMNDRVRREGTQNLIRACRENGLKGYFQQSIIFLYGDNGETIIDESSPLKPQHYIQSASDMESMVRESGLEWRILRGGSFYGPGTGRDEDFLNRARAGNLKIPGDGNNYISLINVADMASAFVTSVTKTKAGSIYNIVDDEPVKSRDLFSYIAAVANAPLPQREEGLTLPSYRCSNKSFRDQTGWRPAFATYRSGLAQYLRRASLPEC
ncbi:MAG: NAD(P)-dependent oxidoreductase [Ignavibacteria bacterium]|jgi:nucleoside-diphosphate-sugar epimerase|nr:NAD(P)-dependent oxidoreductase [Ignavibacteria bacterium]MCU7502255.1 NAD(P)-dependent oxidoreductase [Ignavibacteria bacterium]MCU7516701.1 NAD(P)-dependent oxidoreductase [Ignavibacteria bacterium]